MTGTACVKEKPASTTREQPSWRAEEEREGSGEGDGEEEEWREEGKGGACRERA